MDGCDYHDGCPGPKEEPDCGECSDLGCCACRGHEPGCGCPPVPEGWAAAYASLPPGEYPF